MPKRLILWAVIACAAGCGDDGDGSDDPPDEATFCPADLTFHGAIGVEAWCERAGLREGPYHTWFSSGNDAVDGQYAGGKRTGTWSSWFVNEQLASIGDYADDRETGTWTRYWADGSEAEVATYAAGQLDGAYRRTYEGGAIREQGAYAKDIRVGAWTFFYANGMKRAAGAFDHGFEQGPWTFWDEQGRVESEGTYDRGYAEGTYKAWYYDEGYAAYETGMVHVGEYIGHWVGYTADGAHQLLDMYYVESLAHGPAKTWYPSGAPRSQGEWRNGLRTGTWLFWDANGTMTMQEYP